MLCSWLKGLICTPRPNVFLTDISLFDWIHCFYMLLVAGSCDVIKYKSILLCRPIYMNIYESHSICHGKNFLGVKTFATQKMSESTYCVLVNVTIRCGYLYRSQWQVAEKRHIFWIIVFFYCFIWSECGTKNTKQTTQPAVSNLYISKRWKVKLPLSTPWRHMCQ